MENKRQVFPWKDFWKDTRGFFLGLLLIIVGVVLILFFPNTAPSFVQYIYGIGIGVLILAGIICWTAGGAFWGPN